MMILTELDRPRIDIELYGCDSYISAIDKVHIMDEDSFEHFTMEWLYGYKKSNYVSIKKIGGAGDKGRDIVAYRNDETIDYYQCKHYKKALNPTDYYLELGKLCYYTYNKEIPIPNKYYIIASNDVGSSLQDMIDNPEKLLLNLLKSWDKYCKTKITKTVEVRLEQDFLQYIKSFDFSIIETYPMAQVIDEYLNTIYGSIRFGGRRVDIPTSLLPCEQIEIDEMNYISALLEAYSDELGFIIDSVEKLKVYSCYYEHLNRQRKYYYSAETIRRFVRDTFTNSKQFDVLKDEMYEGIIDTHQKKYSSGYERLIADLEQATKCNTSKSLLDSKMHCIGNCERKGTCHMLANEKKIRWVEENERHF